VARKIFEESGGIEGYGRFNLLTLAGRRNVKYMVTDSAQEKAGATCPSRSSSSTPALTTALRQGVNLSLLSLINPLPVFVTPTNRLDPCGAGWPYTRSCISGL
jgi:hypothetical protein